MKYCNECGSATENKIPEGDNRPRDCCTVCDLIHYTNPKIICGTIPVRGESVLLCKRAIEPRYGKVHLPYLGSMALLHKRTDSALIGIVPHMILGFV